MRIKFLSLYLQPYSCVYLFKDMEKTIRQEHRYKHNINDVWNAISSAEEISAWFIKADFKAEVGYDYTFTHESTVIEGKVLEASPVHTLVYTWIVKGTGVETTVRWKLKEEGDETVLNIEHSGIENYPNDEMITAMFTNFSNGWVGCAGNLAKYLNDPASV